MAKRKNSLSTWTIGGIVAAVLAAVGGGIYWLTHR